jgi:hypothetical protein
MTKYTRDILTKAKKFKGKVNEAGQTITFDKPLEIKSRADALDILFLLTAGDNWMCDFDEPLEALRRFIENLPEEQEGKP